MVDRRSTRLVGTAVDHTGPSKPRCGYCGKPYAPRPGSDCCRACDDLFSQTGYYPAWDREFVDKLATIYIENYGTFVRASRLMGCTAADVRDGRKILVRWGFVFEGDKHLGTRLVGWSRLKETA